MFPGNIDPFWPRGITLDTCISARMLHDGDLVVSDIDSRMKATAVKDVKENHWLCAIFEEVLLVWI